MLLSTEIFFPWYFIWRHRQRIEGWSEIFILINVLYGFFTLGTEWFLDAVIWDCGRASSHGCFDIRTENSSMGYLSLPKKITGLYDEIKWKISMVWQRQLKMVGYVAI